MSTYSRLLWQGEMPTAETTIFTVPAAELVILRDAEWFNANPEATPAQLQTTVPGFAVAVVCRINDIGPGAGAQWQGRVVLPGGSSIQAAAPRASLYLCLSGYSFEA